MKTIVFPGQGSQSKGMGDALFDEFPELTNIADEILGYSIRELCLEDPNRQLSKTEFTQPALYVVNAFSYLSRMIDTTKKPDYLAGHSLGEYNALLAAECFDFETGLKLVKKRGELMGQISGGGMAAVLKGSREQVEEVLSKYDLNDIDVANYNALSQIVISGLHSDIEKAQHVLQENKLLFIPLNTAGAFHSRYMLSAEKEFSKHLSQYKFNNLKIPVISNVSARPYQNEKVVQLLSSQISHTVRWLESIQFLINVGAEESSPMMFEEIGHGETLAKIIRTIENETHDAVNVTTKVQEKDTGYLHSQAEDLGSYNQAALDSVNTKNDRKFSACEKVASWNQNYPVGTRVYSSSIPEKSLKTRTEAVVLFDSRAVVYVEGYNGYFPIDELKVVDDLI